MECTLIEEILKDPKKRKEIPDITTTTTEEAIQVSVSSDRVVLCSRMSL
jgi:hypothetical protein